MVLHTILIKRVPHDALILTFDLNQTCSVCYCRPATHLGGQGETHEKTNHSTAGKNVENKLKDFIGKEDIFGSLELPSASSY